MTALTLVSHYLCPFVQRAAIALDEKNIPFTRLYVDLSNKPDWFKQLSPLGKVPVLQVGEGDQAAAIFESAVILEYLEETQPNPLHPADPLERAQHRSWIEFGSSILNVIGGFYNAPTGPDLSEKAGKLIEMFGRIEGELAKNNGPWFAGQRFSLVDAVYGPIFRYFDVIEKIDDFGIFTNYPKTSAWRQQLAARPSIQKAVTDDYPERLMEFFRKRPSELGRLAA